MLASPRQLEAREKARKFRIFYGADESRPDEYERYCQWCESLRIVPAQPSMWAQVVASIPSY